MKPFCASFSSKGENHYSMLTLLPFFVSLTADLVLPPPACPKWTHGAGCSKECDCVREHSAGCDPKTGSCFCRAAYHGPRCEEGRGTSEKRRAADSPTALTSASRRGERCRVTTPFHPHVVRLAAKLSGDMASFTSSRPSNDPSSLPSAATGAQLQRRLQLRGKMFSFFAVL